jgi:hypothetical protein
MMPDRKLAARRKIVKMLPRLALERLSGMAEPEYANRGYLVEQVMANWDIDDIRLEMEAVLKRSADKE